MAAHERSKQFTPFASSDTSAISRGFRDHEAMKLITFANQCTQTSLVTGDFKSCFANWFLLAESGPLMLLLGSDYSLWANVLKK